MEYHIKKVEGVYNELLRTSNALGVERGRMRRGNEFLE